MNKNNNLINEMRELLDMKPKIDKPKLTLESLVFGEDNIDTLVDNDDEASVDEKNEEAPIENDKPNTNNEEETNPLDEDPEVTKIITNIRIQVLQGMTKLASNPNSAQYELLKKMFVIIDKAVEDKVKTK